MTRSAILVVGPSWVGDMVMAHSLLQVLATRNPESDIDMLAPPWSLPIIRRMPGIRDGIELPTRHGELGLGTRRELAGRLRATAYEQAIVLPRSLKAALVPWLAHIPRRTGFRGEMRFGLINDMRPSNKEILNQTVKRFVALGLDAGETLARIPPPKLSVSVEGQKQVMDRLGLEPERPVVAMMPGAEYGPAKCWPLAHFTQAAEMLDARGFDVWVLGSPRDAAAGAAISRDGHAQNLCGRTELVDVVDLLAACDHSISNDSGLMHIAAAVGSRVSAIYGSTTPEFTPPLTDNAVLHYLKLDCSPCFKRECPLGHLRCLQDISPASVADAVVGYKI